MKSGAWGGRGLVCKRALRAETGHNGWKPKSGT